ncbi:MAG: BatD family protein [Pseudomonadota bacterium]|nr:BatD family protein [Pseudomonadota bacterium]MEE2748790.1 BatD family protein [Pseudomonadota bacterium]
MRALIAAAFLLLSQLAAAADLIASVDRKQIGRADPVTLQIVYSDVQAGFLSLLNTDMPDMSQLERDWNIVGRPRISKESSNINGNRTAQTRWEVELLPRRSGEVLIPSLSFKGQYTDPIRIQVKDTQTTQPEKTENFYFEVEVSSGTHYVQEQLLYIERMYYTVNHEDAVLSEFEVANARVQPLMDAKQYLTVVDGQRIGVYERRYALFPESSGTLTIPGQRFTARVTDRFNRFRGSAETIVSKPIELQIQPIPDNYPQAPWIPASRFTLEETFSAPPTEWQVGEPVTRTFTIKATGLSAGQVPPIPMAEVPGVRYYPDQTQDNSSISDQGITTVVTQSVAVVPGNTGDLILPEIRIPWWNTLENRVEYATLPEHNIQVIAAKASTSPSDAIPELTGSDEANNDKANAAETTQSYLIPLIVSIGFNLLLLAAIIGLYLSRKNQTTVTSTEDTAKAEKASKEETHYLWRELKKAARDNNAQALREMIIRWAASESGQSMTSLAQAEVWLDDFRLSAALAELDATLYSTDDNSAFNGQGIIGLIEKALKAKKEKQNTSRNESVLPELY